MPACPTCGFDVPEHTPLCLDCGMEILRAGGPSPHRAERGSLLDVNLVPHRRCLRAGDAGRQKVFAMLKVMPLAELACRPSLAFVFAIDTSGSMRAYADQRQARREAARRGTAAQPVHDDQSSIQPVWLDLPSKADVARQAAQALLDDRRLQPDDQLGVCSFNDEATVWMPLSELGDGQEARRALEGLRDCRGDTRMACGMAAARLELEKAPEGSSRRVLLLTDGRTLDEEECYREADRLARQDIPLVAAGVGVKYNEQLLLELAGRSAGRSYHLGEGEEHDPEFATDGSARNAGALDRLRHVLDDEVDLAVREAVTRLEATVSTARGVGLESVTRVYPSVAEVSLGSAPYRLGSVASGDYTVFVLEFNVSGLDRPPCRARLATVELSGRALATGRFGGVEPHPLWVSFSADEADLADVNEEVRGYVDQRTMDRELRRAIHLAEASPGEACRVLQAVAGMADEIGNRDLARVVRSALRDLQTTGALSPEIRKAIALGGRTRTVRSHQAGTLEGIPAEALDEVLRP